MNFRCLENSVSSGVIAASLALLLSTCSGDKSPTQPTVRVPELTTAAVTSLTRYTAVCGGTVASDGGADVTDRGVCWSANQSPTTADAKTSDGTGTGTFVSDLFGLTPGTTYYIRAYASNTAGTAYGTERSFTTELTAQTASVTDYDGNVYPTVKIGNQWWMAQNLKVTHYRNGSSLPNVMDDVAWSTLTTGAYCNSGNDEARAATYGRLYNWFAVADSRNIAPLGWHVPSDAEFQTLFKVLGGDAVAGAKLKEIGTVHWQSPNTDATNESGFSALPGGIRTDLGYFAGPGFHALFWSRTQLDPANGNSIELAYDFANAIGEFDPKTCGFSVRCVKDN